MYYPTIPPQHKGGFHDTVSMQCLNSTSTAVESFKVLEKRLKSVNDWYAFSDKVKAKFTLFDARGEKLSNGLHIGDLIRIDIPGLGNPSGEGYDWVEIINVQENEGENEEIPFFAITVKPCPAPLSDSNNTAHFYSAEASSTFIVRRIGSCLLAEVHGRNEVENVSDVPALDIVRNKTVAIGSKFGIGSINWLAFTDALLKPFTH